MNLVLTLKKYSDDKEIVKLIESKSKKLEKYLTQNFNMSWNIFTIKNQHYAEVKVTGFKGKALMTSVSSSNPFKLVDDAINKLVTQAHKRKTT